MNSLKLIAGDGLEQNMIDYNPMWNPVGGWESATPAKTGVTEVKESWGGYQQYYGDQSGWSLYAYTENGSTKTISDGGVTKDVYALVRKEGNDLDGFFYMIEKLVVIDGNQSLQNATSFKEATPNKDIQVLFRGTIKDDQIGRVKITQVKTKLMKFLVWVETTWLSQVLELTV